ncbi:MAG: diguanylate cyclase [Oscillospiraceae bacterium]|nr:diguanylate cyclase [Oscillospiraceae bacterium]
MNQKLMDGLLCELRQMLAASESGRLLVSRDRNGLTPDALEAIELVEKIVENHKSEREHDLLKYKLAADALSIASWDMVIEGGAQIHTGTEINWSQEFRQSLGFEDENDLPNVLGALLERIHPEDRENAYSALLEHVYDHSGETPFNIEFLAMTKNGDYHNFSASGLTLRDNNGIPYRSAGAIVNTDQQKHTQTQLKIMSNIVHNSPSFITYKTIDGKCLYVNPGASSLTGYSQDELMEDYIRKLFGDNGVEYFNESVSNLLESGVARHELQAMMKNGETRIMEGTSFLVDKNTFATISTDVTDVREAEFEKIRALTTFQTILNSLDAMIYVTVPETGEILFVNEHMKEQYALGDDVIGQYCYKVFQENMDAKCEFCPCHKLDDTPDETIVWEETSVLTKRIYRNSDRYVDWFDGRKVHVQHSVDITDLVVARSSLTMAQNSLKEALVGSFSDALTGIYNRRHFNETLDRMVKTLSRASSALSLLMIDLDFFKKFNDTYGHPAGDECLLKVATAIRQCLPRIDDFVARYGGEEFVVVLPNTDEQGARRISEKLLICIRDLKIPHEQNDGGYVTISIGATSSFVERSQSAGDFIKKADKMLYASKHGGRNQYSFERL